ncbi:GNAT family N-acetyltransferase [Cryptosporangium sp. NPDC048952]|uniref:GNAT family N-acetyltransferase n=1 Tax=Cryptosporangium sp. NPDC048952 TaxID=3363961 RepID=UPI003717707A
MNDHGVRHRAPQPLSKRRFPGPTPTVDRNDPRPPLNRGRRGPQKPHDLVDGSRPPPNSLDLPGMQSHTRSIRYVIETERLFLRPLTVDDVDTIVDLHADPRVNQFVGSYTRAEALARLTTIERQWNERGHGQCAVELKSTGELIGRSGLRYWDEFDETEVGWTFRAEHWGHGYATEAARACVDWGFAHLPIDYLTAMIRPANLASIRVAERLGFSVRRDDVLGNEPITIFALNRP